MDLKKLEAIIKIEPNNPRHWFNLGIAYLQENRIDAAHKSFEESVKINPYFASSQFLLGVLLLYGRDFKNGVKYLEKARTIDEDVYNKLLSDSNIRNLLSTFIKATLKVIQDQLEFQPNNIEILSAMGKILLYTNSFESAINYFRKIIELKPDNWEAYVYLGLAYEGLEEYEQAIFYLKKAIVNHQYLAEAYWIMARVYQKMGNYGMALKSYEKAVELSPSNPRYLNSLANIYLTLDKNIQAIKTLQLAIDTNPNSKWSYYYLGQCMEKEYNFELAIEQYEKALNIDPYFLEAKLSLAKLYQMSNPKRAIEILEEIVNERQDIEILYLLAQLYYSQNNYHKSKQITEQILKINPQDENAFYLYTLSLLNIYKQGEYVNKESLIRNMEVIYEKNPLNSVVSTELLKLYVDNKDFVKAKEVLEKSRITIKDKDVAEKVAFIYLQNEEYDKLLSLIKSYKLFSINFFNDVLIVLREKNSPYLPIVFNEMLNSVEGQWQESEIIGFEVKYLEYLYFSNTLQALEFYKQKFSEEIKNKYNLYLIELLIYFVLYCEYKDKNYLDNFIKVADKYLSEIFEEVDLKIYEISPKIRDTIKLAIYFYFIIIKSKHDLILRFYEFLKKSSIESTVLITALSEVLPVFLDNSYYHETLDLIENFELSNIEVFKKFKIETLLLLNRNQEVTKEVEEYFHNFSYDSYIDLLGIVAKFEISKTTELMEKIKNIVVEFNPLALALYAQMLIDYDLKEAQKYADRALELIYTGRHSFKYIYQIVFVIDLLSKFFEAVHKISHFIKELKQIVSKYPDIYVFNYLLAKYLFIVEDFVDAELIAKKALKLTHNSTSLLETQNLLSKIREQKEKYQKFLADLEKIDPQISEKIAYINSLYKKDKIEEIYKILEETTAQHSISNVIIRFYIFDKLEIKEQVIYHLNLLKMFSIENSLESLTEFIEDKLLFYSNIEEFEEIKHKAEMDYIKFYKRKQEKIEKEIKESEYTVNEKVEIENTQGVKQNICMVEDYQELENYQILDYEGLIFAYLLKITSLLHKDENVYKKVEKIIQNSAIELKKENQLIINYLENIESYIQRNDLRAMLIDIKKFSNTFPHEKFIIFFFFIIVAFLTNKKEELIKYIEYAKKIIKEKQYLKKIIDFFESYNIQTYYPQLLNLSKVKSYQEIKNSSIYSLNELFLAYFMKLYFLTLLNGNKTEFLEIVQEIDKKIENFEKDLDNGIKNEQAKEILSFLKNAINYILNNDFKQVLMEIKNFSTKYKEYDIITNLSLFFIGYKLKKKQEFEKLKDWLVKNKDKVSEFGNFIEWIERMEVKE